MTHRPARCASRPGRSWRFAAYAGLAFAIASASAACDAVLDIQEYPAGSVADASLDDATLADTEGHDTGRTDAPVSDAQADVTDAAHEDTRGPDAADDATATDADASRDAADEAHDAELVDAVGSNDSPSGDSTGETGMADTGVADTGVADSGVADSDAADASGDSTLPADSTSPFPDGGPSWPGTYSCLIANDILLTEPFAGPTDPVVSTDLIVTETGTSIVATFTSDGGIDCSMLLQDEGNGTATLDPPDTQTCIFYLSSPVGGVSVTLTFDGGGSATLRPPSLRADGLMNIVTDGPGVALGTMGTGTMSVDCTLL